MKTYMKSVRHTFENKYVSLPFYALLGTSAVILAKHFLFNKDKDNNDNFRAGATQFDNKQLGTLEPDASGTDKSNYQENTTLHSEIKEQESPSDSEVHTIQEKTLTPEIDSIANSTPAESIEQIELPSDNMEIPENSLISTIDEVTASTPENKEQCKAITKKGTRCRNKADSSGYCFQHRALR